MMSLFTMTGKTAYYDVHKREMDVPFAIPCTEEQVEKFPLYLDTVVTDRSSGRVSCIVSKQHKKMIPKRSRITTPENGTIDNVGISIRKGRVQELLVL